ncbi:glutamate receptor 2.9-like [Punica granatum]|nr:glutamate receptor 2.9-like [Punica granatum]
MPGLIQMGSDKAEQIRCMANIVRSFNRHRGSIIYEEDTYDDSYSFSLYLSKELLEVMSEMEDQVVLPPYSSLSDPESVVKQKLRMFKGKLSPVFIILDLSLPMARHLLKEAKQMGYFRGDSIWVLSESVLNLLNSVHSNVTFSMKGAIGVVTDLPRKNKEYLDFIHKFHRKLNHEARDSMPGIHVLRAYDSITMVTKAMDGASSSAEITSKLLMKRMLQSKFDGLSGQVAFIEGRILNPRKPKLVSISDGTKLLYEELNIWSPQNALSAANTAVQELKHGIEESKVGEATCSVSDVHLSGPMKIGVPRHTPFDKFVKEEVDDSTGKIRYIGFCIEVFERLLFLLKSTSAQTFDDYHFVSHNGSYDDLVQEVRNKTYNAAVGDITILANRSKDVDFTQPFIESGLSMIVVAEVNEKKMWIFLKPFTPVMWMASGGILIITMLTVWSLEHPSNPEFRGPWTDQLSTALWFTFSSIFFAHRERIYGNLTRIVLGVWFFMALILTQSYTASLTSMLTVHKLKQNEITMERLRQNNAKVGCDNSTFVCNFLERVHNFKPNAIVGITNYTDFHEQLNKGSIKAMFVEYPYERAFFSRYCSSGFLVTHQSYRFGGFGFAFEKGSPWTAKFSEAILELSESGDLKKMGDEWFREECPTVNGTASASSDSETQSLRLRSFWALHVFSLGTSALCLLLSCFCSRRNGDKYRANNAVEQLNRARQHEGGDHEMDELHSHRR